MTWRDTIVDLTNASDPFLYNFEESAFPSVSPTCSNDTLYLIFQTDPEAGAADKGAAQGQTSPTDNEIRFMKPSKNLILQLGVGINEQEKKINFSVSQNMPNPFRDYTRVMVNTDDPATISIGIYTMLGKKVTEINKGTLNRGSHQFVLDGSNLVPGVYFYTVTINGESITKKMILE
jgi:hypothetical protein